MLNFQLIESLLLKNDAKIAVAVSGGADSMCLINIAKEYVGHNGGSVVALTVDHGLRPESSEEAAKVQKFLESKGINSVVLQWSGDKPKSNIQMNARNARYKILTDYCKDHGIKYLLIGHNANDQAETVMLRIIRGTGVDGLSGMERSSKKHGVYLLRPLLSIKRSKIEAYLAEIGWWYVNDPSNANTKYDRVKVRNILAIYSKEFGDDKVIDRLNLLSKNAARNKKFMKRSVSDAWIKYVSVSKYNYLELDNAVYGLEDELKLRLFVRCMQEISGAKLPPRLRSLEKLLNAMSKDGLIIKTLMGCEIHKGKKTTVIFREYKEDTNEILGKRGWAILKGVGFEKPDVPNIKIIYTTKAKWEGDDLVSWMDCYIAT